MALDHDFYLTSGATSLGFNKAITRETPEERATAQFRKEQFDSQATVGDQSLTGWWTRGQLSFHKGAGVTYYEVLEGESVLNRFNECEGVEVFDAGQVTLARDLSASGIAAVDGVPASLTDGAGAYLLTNTGVTYTAGSGTTSIATSDANVPTSIASSGRFYYVTNGTFIERQFAASEARVNHVTNPSFEVDTAGWTGDPSMSGSYVQRFEGTGRYGNATMTAAAIPSAGLLGAVTTVSGLTVGQTYVASAWIKLSLPPGTSASPRMAIDGVAFIGASVYDEWQRLALTFTATATSRTLQVYSVGGGGNAPAIIIDAVMVTEAPFAGDYFDGAQPGCAWQGTPHASKSDYSTASDGTSVVRVTITDNVWEKVWWAKGRLWAVDGSNNFFAVADDVASVDVTDKFWTSTNSDPKWSLADSPGPVYISDGSDIFAVTIDNDGLVPTLTSPTTVARVPLGEQVVDLAYYLSNLVVTTTRGVRIAVVQNDQIFLGPLAIEGDFSKTVGGGNLDTTAYVAGRLTGRGGDVVLCAIDLGEANDDLTYPWQPVATLSELSSTADGVIVDPLGRIYAWSAGDTLISSTDDFETSGWLSTGFHRFGTLDDKHFATVTVRTRGEGEVAVYRVDDDDTETLLDTLDAASGESDVALGLPAPAERIALKFVLGRLATDSTKGPTLLGYQLKALPVPKRQRMKRVPLALFDRESNRNGQQMGNDGSAWTRLQALEALEESNAVVDFEDKETGETGSAYIESVEMRRTAPTSRHSDGFGGTVWVTLRVI